MTTTSTMLAPVGTTGLVQTASGNSYTISANGQITGVVAGDILPLLNAGFSLPVGGIIPAQQVPLTSFRNTDGTVLTGSAAAGKFGLVVSPGTSEHLVTQAANNSTISDACFLDFVVPNTYEASDPLTLTVNGHLVIGSGTVTTKSLTANVYHVTNDETISADLCAGVVNFGTAAADMGFVITPGTVTVNPGDRLQVELTARVIETSTNNVTGVLSSVRFS